VEAGSFGTWTFEFAPGDPGLRVGDTLEIVFFTRFSTNLWSLPQTHDPTAPGFVTANRTDGGFVHTEVYRIPSIFRPHGATMHVIKAAIGGDDLVAGAKMSVGYGDTSGGSPGVRAQYLAREVVFPVFIGTGGSRLHEGSKDFARAMASIWRPTIAEVAAAAAFAPALKVVGGRPSRFHVSLPSLAQVGARARARITALDAHGNASPGYDGSPKLLIEDVRNRLASCGDSLDAPGVARITAVDSENRITGTSAPVLVSEEPLTERLFWGEIHTHTILSDALGRIEEHFECAREHAHLDFGGITDHDIWLERNPGAWDEIVRQTEANNRPGEFVTILGYEMMVQAKGRYSSHANIYFPGSKAPMVPSPDIEQIRDLCRTEGAIAIPHHTQYGWPNMGTNWDDWAAFTPDQMPVVEVFSTHGSSEYFGCPRSVLWPVEGQSVQDGLARGHRFGLIAGSDYHECLLGHAMEIERYPRTINNRHMQFHTGLTAVFAPELTREAIFEAIRKRRVYATSGPRIILVFHVDGVPMGGEISLASPNAARAVSVEVHAERTLQSVEIVRDGQVDHTVTPNALDTQFDWKDTSPAQTGTYYYVRATQADGEQAWSSPVWVKAA
jgi:hypothetical protein